MVVGCESEPHSSVTIGKNNDIKVDTLFTVDGCTAYRFFDGGNGPIYFTKCVNSVQSATQWTEQAGKASRQVSVETN